ncbi:hypothetical protein [Microbacterium sp. SORGH_AS_0888]|uniref:hypothetical protein n=1 Tax=Microbacterium sp. SORGH_AS_0888 TaxID=3041791 RepID=UPI0027883EEC|nr:hypothetical protein [Microbacterium sp. SORGH_AS_0888]MDQ1130258.1 hypothetical protein [Microbacterium sp. SORGH_AS_0888]
MSDSDKLKYFGLRMLDACARDDHDAYQQLHREIARSEYDGTHVAHWLAGMVLESIKQHPDWRAILDRQLEEQRLFVEADLDDPDDDGMFLEQ